MRFYSNEIAEYILMVNVSLSAQTSNKKKDRLFFMMDLNMTECPEGQVLKNDETSRFKTCQQAICEGDNACVDNQGICIEDNKCKCFPGFNGKQTIL